MIDDVTVAVRLDRIAHDCWSGQSYSQTKARLDKVAALLSDRMTAEWTDLAAEIRAAAGQKGRNVGRHDAVIRCRDKVAQMIRPLTGRCATCDADMTTASRRFVYFSRVSGALYEFDDSGHQLAFIRAERSAS